MRPKEAVCVCPERNGAVDTGYIVCWCDGYGLDIDAACELQEVASIEVPSGGKVVLPGDDATLED